MEGRTIAVDPDIIPLGSVVYVEGYGVRIAEDTGAYIKGDRRICMLRTGIRQKNLAGRNYK